MSISSSDSSQLSAISMYCMATSSKSKKHAKVLDKKVDKKSKYSRFELEHSIDIDLSNNDGMYKFPIFQNKVVTCNVLQDFIN